MCFLILCFPLLKNVNEIMSPTILQFTATQIHFHLSYLKVLSRVLNRIRLIIKNNWNTLAKELIWLFFAFKNFSSIHLFKLVSYIGYLVTILLVVDDISISLPPPPILPQMYNWPCRHAFGFAFSCNTVVVISKCLTV